MPVRHVLRSFCPSMTGRIVTSPGSLYYPRTKLPKSSLLVAQHFARAHVRTFLRDGFQPSLIALQAQNALETSAPRVQTDQLRGAKSSIWILEQQKVLHLAGAKVSMKTVESDSLAKQTNGVKTGKRVKGLGEASTRGFSKKEDEKAKDNFDHAKQQDGTGKDNASAGSTDTAVSGTGDKKAHGTHDGFFTPSWAWIFSKKGPHNRGVENELDVQIRMAPRTGGGFWL